MLFQSRVQNIFMHLMNFIHRYHNLDKNAFEQIKKILITLSEKIHLHKQSFAHQCPIFQFVMETLYHIQVHTMTFFQLFVIEFLVVISIISKIDILFRNLSQGRAANAHIAKIKHVVQYKTRFYYAYMPHLCLQLTLFVYWR